MKPRRHNTSDTENLPMANNKNGDNSKPPTIKVKRNHRLADPRNPNRQQNRQNAALSSNPPAQNAAAMPATLNTAPAAESRPLQESNLVDISEDEIEADSRPSVPAPLPPPQVNAPPVFPNSANSTRETSTFERVLLGYNKNKNERDATKSSKSCIDFKRFKLPSTVLTRISLDKTKPSSSKSSVFPRKVEIPHSNVLPKIPNTSVVGRSNGTSSSNIQTSSSSTLQATSMPSSSKSSAFPRKVEISHSNVLPKMPNTSVAGRSNGTSSNIQTSSSSTLQATSSTTSANPNTLQPGALFSSAQAPSVTSSPSINASPALNPSNGLLQPNYFSPPPGNSNVEGVNRHHFDNRIYGRYYGDLKHLKPEQVNSTALANMIQVTKNMAYENDKVAEINMDLHQRNEALNQEMLNERHRHQIEVGRLRAIVAERDRTIAEITNDNEKLEKKLGEEKKRSESAVFVLQTHVQREKESNKKLVEENEKLKREHEAMRKKHVLEMNTLSEQKRAIEADRNAEFQKRMDMEQRIDNEIKQNEKTRAKKRDTDKKNQQLENEINDLRKQLEKKDDMVTKLEMGHKDLIKKLKDKDDAILQAKSEAIEIEKKIAALEGQLNTQADQMKKQEEKLKKQVAHSTRQQLSLNNLFTSARTLNVVQLRRIRRHQRQAAAREAAPVVIQSSRQLTAANEAALNSAPSSSRPGSSRPSSSRPPSSRPSISRPASSGISQPPPRPLNPRTPVLDPLQNLTTTFGAPSYAAATAPIPQSHGTLFGAGPINNFMQRTSAQNGNVNAVPNNAPQRFVDAQQPQLFVQQQQQNQQLIQQYLQSLQQQAQHLNQPVYLGQQPAMQQQLPPGYQQVQGPPIRGQGIPRQHFPAPHYPELMNRLQNHASRAAPYPRPVQRLQQPRPLNNVVQRPSTQARTRGSSSAHPRRQAVADVISMTTRRLNVPPSDNRGFGIPSVRPTAYQLNSTNFPKVVKDS